MMGRGRDSGEKRRGIEMWEGETRDGDALERVCTLNATFLQSTDATGTQYTATLVDCRLKPIV